MQAGLQYAGEGKVMLLVFFHVSILLFLQFLVSFNYGRKREARTAA
jgi:hypothetical protein